MTKLSAPTAVTGLPDTDYSLKRVLTAKAVCQLTSLGKSQIHKLVSEGEFPAPIRLSAGRVGYLEHEVLAWLNDRITERDRLLTARTESNCRRPSSASRGA